MLGLEIGTSEAETFWTGFLRKLTRRGLRGVKLVVSDAQAPRLGASPDNGVRAVPDCVAELVTPQIVPNVFHRV